MKKHIHVVGATQHNLKNITVDIPHNTLTVLCGPSGSGKSTLAFDIIYAEGQRRYVESLSAYARQFLDRLEKPMVESIEGLSPAISLEQQGIMKNPRSTVGTTTEIYDFLRVLWARLGTMHCPECGRAIEALSIDEIVEHILHYPVDTKLILLAPVVEYQKGTHLDTLKQIKANGFVRVRVDGTMYTIDDVPALDKNKKHSIEIVVDRISIKEDIRSRLTSSIEKAVEQSNGRVILYDVEKEQEKIFSTSSMCAHCTIHVPSPSPQLFSFNSPQGACPQCLGIGTIEAFSLDLLVPDREKSIEKGGILPLRILKPTKEQIRAMEECLEEYNLTSKTPISKWSEEAIEAFFYGRKKKFIGIIKMLEKESTAKDGLGEFLSMYKSETLCPQCHGARLKKEALSVTIEGLSIHQYVELSIMRAKEWISTLSFSGRYELIAAPLVKEIAERLQFLEDVGLDYVTLARTMATLSGGEAQRIRLASQLGSGLVGVTYVLDEPSIGLHPRDNDRLIRTLRSLQEKGNTVLVVEHDEATMRESDYIVEMGEGAGVHGGSVLFAGPTQELLASGTTITAQYLRGEREIAIPKHRRKGSTWLTFKGINTYNIHDMTCSIPLGTLTCVTGVSGSGKSSLVVDTIYKHVAHHFGLKADMYGSVEHIEGLDVLERVVLIDQTPIGRTPRSNPATYTKIFDEIRTIFSLTPDARRLGYGIGRFSFNVKEGRCGVCNGEGEITIEMHFLPDVHVPCDVCHGKRYNKETLAVQYKGKNIADVLTMTVTEAKGFFENYPSIQRKLEILEEVGLGYLQLGQPSTTLSGGEAQRIKISKELGKKRLPNTLYILDEPTTGLHFHEVGKLIDVLNSLVEQGGTVLVIEHNTDVILCSDYIIDLGPGGGEYGGKIIAEGDPEAIMSNPHSITGEFIAKECAEREKIRTKSK